MSKRKIKTATVLGDGLNRIAAEVVPCHAALIADGCVLSEKGRLSPVKDGSWTGTFVYAKPDEPGFSTEFTVRGIVFAR